MKTKQIAIIGAGNLGLAIAEGLVKKNVATVQDLILTEKQPARIDFVKEKGFNTIQNNIEAIEKSEIIILAVKPGQAVDVLKEITTAIKFDKHILVSCITGLSSETVYTYIDKKAAFFRVMPNTAIAVGESMTCITACNCNNTQKGEINQIFSSLGKVLFINEELMAAATVMAGCGIAFALRFIRAAMQGGIETGFNAETSRIMAIQIAKGAAELLTTGGQHPETEIDKVTTPSGITITGLNEMEHNGFSSAVIKGILTSYKKINFK